MATKIIFTSCSRYEAFPKQPVWKKLEDQNPDYLFLLGDTIYMDYGYWPFSKEPRHEPKKYSIEKFEKLMSQKYENQFCVPEFKSFVTKMRAKNGFYGIWDDHDFAWDNSKGKNVPKEKEKIARKLFHKYLNCSTNYPHTYYHIDTPHARVLFLDNRTDAEEESETAKMLSDEQFNFIKKKLEHTLPYTLICSGLTITEGNENWKKYPNQLKKLCALIESKKNVLFISGDIHLNKFVEQQKIENTDLKTPPQLISSGININYLGLGICLDDKHNWGMLELNDNSVKISFYDKKGKEQKKSEEANKYLKNYITN